MFKKLTAKIANMQSKRTQEAILKREVKQFETELNRVLGEIDKVTKDDSKNSGEGFSYDWDINLDLPFAILKRVQRELLNLGYIMESVLELHTYYRGIQLRESNQGIMNVIVSWDHVKPDQEPSIKYQGSSNLTMDGLLSLIDVPNYVVPESLDTDQVRIVQLVDNIAFAEAARNRLFEYNIHNTSAYDEMITKSVKELSKLKYPKGF